MSEEPERVGDYVIKERVGFGGMADVYRAERHGLGGFVKTVAIKRILPHLLGNENFVKMFIDEARIAASLSHANIVSIHDFGQTGDQLYLVMEFVDGCSLLPVLERLSAAERPFPLRHVLFIILEVCKGLHAAHSRTVRGVAKPVVHRDISPQNILVSLSGEVKITDFGVAKAQGRLSTTQADVLKGKIAYMAPEQVQGEGVDDRSDIFSVGVVMFELLTGRRLFKGDHHAETLMQLLHKELKPPSAFRPKLPAEIDRITMKALARIKRDRYPRVAELGRDISQFLMTTGIEATSIGLADFLRTIMPEGRWTGPTGEAPVSDTHQLSRLLDDLDTGSSDASSPTARGPEDAGEMDVETERRRSRPRAGSRRRFIAIAKDLASQVHSRSDVDLWVQVALLGKIATLEPDSPRRPKLVDALLAAANGRFDEPEQ